MDELARLFVHPLFVQAAWLTVWTAVVSQVAAIVLGIPLGLAQLSNRRVISTLASGYNWVLQGTPLLMQLVFWWAILPMLGLKLPVIVAGLVGLALHEAARMSQIVRAAMIGVDRRQAEAAAVLGMSSWQTLRHVIAPQAIRLALPATGNEFNYQFKATSLLAAISVAELTRQTILFTDRDPANPLPYFLVAAVYYLVMSTAWGLLQTRVERLLARRGFAGESPDRLNVRAEVRP